jgi:hypothetical protein
MIPLKIDGNGFSRLAAAWAFGTKFATHAILSD